jgi:hypothetical protein
MRQLAMLLAFVFGLTTIPLTAGTLNGVTLPDSAEVGSTTFILNGMGLRTKFMVKVYVAGLYLPQTTSNPGNILKADAPKRIVMHFVRDVSKSQLTDGFTESFNNNTPDAAKSQKADIDRFFAALDSMKDDQELSFTYFPETGTTISVAGADKLTIAGPDFAFMLFSVWLGPKPPNEGLKKGILLGHA